MIEHIQNDKAAVDWIYDHLKDGGLVIATVPAYQWFFSDHDRVLGHFRRYTTSNFEELYTQNFSISVYIRIIQQVFTIFIKFETINMFKNKINL